MEITFNPSSELEQFGNKILFLLVENFPQSFYVGGMVRDLLLRVPITDIDIATQALPKEVIKILQSNGIKYSDHNAEYGIVTATEGDSNIEIATFRKDVYRQNRYPKVKYIESSEEDSQRRDFTVNALYFNPITQKVSDYHNGISDLEKSVLRFIGDPETRIAEDPLRIIRAVRFASDYAFTIETKSLEALVSQCALIKSLTQSRVAKEISKAKKQKTKLTLEKILQTPQALDKFIFSS